MMKRRFTNRPERVISRLAVGCGLALIMGVGPSLAGEHWQRHGETDVPWREPQGIASFDDRLFVSANESAEMDATRMWTTEDGRNWHPVPAFDGRIVQSFSIHEGALYALSAEEATDERRIYRSFDGSTWNRADSGEFGAGEWSDSVSYEGWLVVTARPDRLWRTNGSGGSPSWASLPGPAQSAFSTVDHIILSEWNGLLYAGVIHEDLIGRKSAKFTHLRDAREWGQAAPPADQNFLFQKVNVVTYGGRQIWGGAQLKSRRSWYWMEEEIAGNPVPFVLHDRLYVLNLGANIRRQTSFEGPASYVFIDQPSPAYCEANRRRYSNVAHLGDRAYFLPCDLWSLKKGVYSVANVPVPEKPLTFDLTNEPILTFSVSVSLEDTLERVSIRHRGLAETPRDLAAMRLVDARTFKRLADLSPDETGRVWTTPASFAHRIVDDAIFGVVVDIGNDPRRGATIELAVERLEWRETRGYDAPAAIESAAFSIDGANPARSAPIDDVAIFPNPARNEARFAFNLTERSDVVIDLFDRAGARVIQSAATGLPADPRASTALDISGLAPGLYFATISIRGHADAERIYRGKLVVER